MAKKLSALSRHGKLTRVRNGDISLTDEIKKELAKLKRRKVDLSDPEAPQITDFEGAIRAKFYRPIKSQITTRIDADVLYWFKRHSEKYQSLINKACREYMKLHSHNENTFDRLNNTSPGEVLFEKFLKPLNITEDELAKTIKISTRVLNEIIHGKRNITVDIDLRFARALGTFEGFWIGLQTDYDLEERKAKIISQLKHIHSLAHRNDSSKNSVHKTSNDI